ncbi:hypothetical protein BGX26_005794 [Mortierella sp. AD094]|nr:hypothetical protein BGX26_005794 [Mortierella sp. AD094]
MPRLPGKGFGSRIDHSSTMHDSSYDSNPEDGEDIEDFDPDDHNYRYKFGTDLPNTVDLRSAIESCDTLCRFALHYTKQSSAVHGNDLGMLSPDMRANLQKIRYMNTTMLIGLQHLYQKPNDKGAATEGQGGESEDSPANSAQPGRTDRQERETSPVRFDGLGQPPHEVVHELAKAATSIFQLAIRIKAWVSMTPEQRELDEDINMIRGKRCLLMDSTLASATVDRHGNVQKDWTVVPAASSTSKSFYERQRDLDQQRPLVGQAHNQKQGYQQPFMKQGQSPGNGDMSNRSKLDGDLDDRFGKRGGGGLLMPSSKSHGSHSYQDNASSSFSSDSNMSKSHDRNARSHGFGKADSESGSLSNAMNSRNSKNGDVPYQKYRKRAKRTQPPGRCLSCDSSDTPEWRRGPDGARTLCNACGLHYAKLLKRQNGMGPQQLSSGPPMKQGLIPNIPRMGPQQAITFPLRKSNISQSQDPSSSRTESPAALESRSLMDVGGSGGGGSSSSDGGVGGSSSSISRQREPTDSAVGVTEAIAATSLENDDEPEDDVAMKQEPQ